MYLYTTRQDGVAERKNKHFVEIIRTLLIRGGFDPYAYTIKKLLVLVLTHTLFNL